ncbi:LuxR C-terminal-related transcriptional regulator [Lentzea sp. NPDC059081]|uniref:helix-turn-helix transcriptional regulator n=1 Tax=Lentzea sp. NPDC059081 TaxID=3346719 RepID=UPI0036CD9423
MKYTNTTIFAADPLTNAGITAFLQEDRSISLVPPVHLSQLEVAIVAAKVVDDGTLDLLDRLTSDTAAHAVLVTGPLRASTVERLARTRVHRILDRARIDCVQLVDATLEAGDSPDVLRLYDEGQQTERLSAQHTVVSDASEPAGDLSPREVEVLRLIADGFATEEIADRLSFSVRTVKNIVHQLTSRLNLVNRIHAVAHAVRVGLI